MVPFLPCGSSFSETIFMEQTMIDTAFIFSLITAVIALGGIFIGVGVIKGKLSQTIEVNSAQTKQIENCASKEELAAAIRRSDELLDIMRKRAEEDRLQGDGRYKELYGIISAQGERVGKLEISQEQIFKMLDKLEVMVSGGFHDMRQDMKELREALK
jgi:hypothetical protein